MPENFAPNNDSSEREILKGAPEQSSESLRSEASESLSRDEMDAQRLGSDPQDLGFPPAESVMDINPQTGEPIRNPGSNIDKSPDKAENETEGIKDIPKNSQQEMGPQGPDDSTTSMLRLGTVRSLPSSNSPELFNSYDTDGDGAISSEEVEDFQTEDAADSFGQDFLSENFEDLAGEDGSLSIEEMDSSITEGLSEMLASSIGPDGEISPEAMVFLSVNMPSVLNSGGIRQLQDSVNEQLGDSSDYQYSFNSTPMIGNSVFQLDVNTRDRTTGQWADSFRLGYSTL